MKVTLNKYNCEVSRQDTDPKRFGNESTLMHHVKLELISMGYDVIKKRMWKDGHLVDDTQQYIRSRAIKTDKDFYIYSGVYALRDLSDDWNKEGKVIFNKCSALDEQNK
jgi:hypothetical protein